MPLLGDIRAVKSVGDTADNRLDDIEWLRHELGNASPGHESDLMRLLLSRVTLNNMFQFCADSGGSRPRIRDDVAHHSDLISLGVPR